jgi:hypothetical protein
MRQPKLRPNPFCRAVLQLCHFYHMEHHPFCILLRDLLIAMTRGN